MNIKQWESRSTALACATIEHVAENILGFIQSVIEDAGGEWHDRLAIYARVCVDRHLSNPRSSEVIQYHAASGARHWPTGTLDDLWPRMVQKTASDAGGALGGLMADCVAGDTLQHLIERPHLVPPEVTLNIAERINRPRPAHDGQSYWADDDFEGAV